MALLNVEVWDATGTKRQEVQMPDDAPVNRILAVLLEKMNFPQYAPDGQPLSYKFHHKASGKQLIDEQTLADVGVKSGDVLRLQPEITAGAGLAWTRLRKVLETICLIFGAGACRPGRAAGTISDLRSDRADTARL